MITPTNPLPALQSAWTYRVACVLLVFAAVACDTQTRPDVDPESGNLWRGMSAPTQVDEAARFSFERDPKPLPDPDVRKTELFGPRPEKPKPPKPSLPDLKVERWQPTGDVGVLNSVSVTFNQPMVPLSGVTELRDLEPPFKLSPKPPQGTFRWLGTSTIVYETPDRFPFATKYTVTVPKGTASMGGKTLDEGTTFTFQTPRPKVTSYVPGNGSNQLKPDTPFLLTFNQRINPQDVFPFIQMKAGTTKVPLKLLSLAEAKAMPQLQSVVSSLDEKRAQYVVAVVPQTKLPLDSAISLTLSKGFPSAEGPLTSSNSQSASFRTYAPLRVQGIGCNYRYSKDCSAGSTIRVGFNNTVPAQPLDAFFQVTPKPPGKLTVSASGNRVFLQAAWKPGQAYSVRVLPGIKDVFKQTLGKGSNAKVSFRDLDPSFNLSTQRLVAIESNGPLVLPSQATNIKTVEVQAQRIDPKDLYAALDHLGRMYDRTWSPFQIRNRSAKGGRVVKDTIRLKGEKNVSERIGIPLKGLIRSGENGLALVVAKSPEVQNRYTRGYQATVVQATDITLTLRYDNDTFIALATRLSTGAPVANADVRVFSKLGKVLLKGTTNAQGLFVSQGLRDREGKVRAPDGTSKGSRYVAPFLAEASLGRERSYALVNGRGLTGYRNAYAYAYDLPDRDEETQLLGSVISDRNIYRPGEAVHWKYTFRINDPYKGTRALPTELKSVTYNIRDARGQVLVKDKKAPLSEFDSMVTNFQIPLTAALGPLTITAYLEGATGNLARYIQHSVDVQEYRAPEFAVSVQNSKEHYFFEDSLLGTISADYLFGAPMRGASVSWNASMQPTNFTPPNQGKFQFGEARFGRYYMPWGEGGFYGRRGYWGGPPSRPLASGSGITGDDGKYTVEALIKSKLPNPHTNAEEDLSGAWKLTLNASVVDQNRQTIAAQATSTVHPAAFYAGLRVDSSIVKEGEQVKFSAVAANPKGERLAGQALKARVLRRTSERTLKKSPNGGHYYDYEQKEEEVGSCDLTTRDEPVRCDVRVVKAGYHIIQLKGQDDAKRVVLTERGFYAYGKSFVPWNQDGNFTVELIADKESYSVGDTARVLVKSPFAQALGLMTVERGFIVKHELLDLKSSTTTIEVPITEDSLPGLNINIALGRGRVQIDGLKAQESSGSDLGKPAVAHASIRLPIDLKTKTLGVDIQTNTPSIRPGDELEISLTTRNAKGDPISSEVALFVVDEAVLSLLGYSTPELVSAFFPAFGSTSVLSDIRSILISQEKDLKVGASTRKQLEGLGYANAEQRATGGALGLKGAGRGGGGMADGDMFDMKAENMDEVQEEAERAPSPNAAVATGKKRARRSRNGFQAKSIKARTNFLTTAYANGAIKTDAQGRAKVRVKMPENLTTYRIMAIAIDSKDQFGSGESSVKIRKPLLVRPSLPRFANLGDSFEASVVVNNETSDDMVAVVGMRGTRIKTSGKDRQEVRIESGKSAEVRFPVTVESSGTATFQFVARSGQDADAAEVSIPVYIPVTTEAFATYGTTEGSVAQPVKLPGDVVPSWGSLDIEMSSTALTGLKDAVRYLHEYPYGCLEQTSSRLVPLVVMRDIVQDFKLEGLDSREMRDARAKEGIKRLLKMQQSNGGFSFWPGGRYTSPYATIYAYWVLVRAKESGFDVPQTLLNRAEDYIRRRMRYDIRKWGEWYSLSTYAHAGYALALNGRSIGERELKRIYAKKDSLPLFSVFHLYGAMGLEAKNSKKPDLYVAERKELRRLIDNAVVEKAGTIHFRESTREDLRLVMNSSTRTDAIALDVLMLLDPDASVVPKVMRGIMQSRKRTGYWTNTQENAYVVSSMARYYAHYEKQPPEFTSSIWYGDEYLGQETFAGRSTTVTQASIPMKFLLQEGDQDITLAKDGPGRLYYRLGLRYAPASRTLEPEEQGFSVTRVFEPLGDDKNVSKTSEGWTIKAGTDVKVKLTITVPDRAYHVAVNDPLPAGLEAVNLKFKTSNPNLNSASTSTSRSRWWWGSTFEHTEQRDERVLLFARALYAGVYEYTYVARATTIGTFILPPLKAEEMYAPENFGRNGTETVRVVP